MAPLLLPWLGLPWRDRDLPPGFDGDPANFKQFERDLKLWRFDTEIPEKKHGVKLLRVLTGSARAARNELKVEEITTDKGLDNILAKLKEHYQPLYQPHLETTMPKAFEKAVRGDSRRGKESLGDFILRQEAAFRELGTPCTARAT